MNAALKPSEIGSVDDENVLRGLDFQLGVDSSGSTEIDSHRFSGKSRLGEIEEEVQRFSAVASRYDSDGVTLHDFSDTVETYDNVKAQFVRDTFSKITSGGATDLAGCIRAITQKAVESKKPNVACIWTDGAASDRADVIKALAEAAKATGGRPKLGIVIVQVGQDSGASAFLRQLDNELGSRGIPDMVACVTIEQASNLSFGNLIWLAQNK
jgi:uncharacterized protein with GYD domain